MLKIILNLATDLNNNVLMIQKRSKKIGGSEISLMLNFKFLMLNNDSNIECKCHKVSKFPNCKILSKNV